jgi:thioredoxin-related protein
MTKHPKLIWGVIAFVIVAGYAFYLTLPSDPTPANERIVWKSFDEGVILAKQTNKKVLVDVFTDWCTWCKKMDSDVYSRERVAQLVNSHFVAVKLNPEISKSVSFKGRTITNSEFAVTLGATGYPTTVFFDQDANPITNLAGYVESDRFSRILEFIGKDHYKSESFDQFLARTPKEF